MVWRTPRHRSAGPRHGQAVEAGGDRCQVLRRPRGRGRSTRPRRKSVVRQQLHGVPYFAHAYDEVVSSQSSSRVRRALPVPGLWSCGSPSCCCRRRHPAVLRGRVAGHHRATSRRGIGHAVPYDFGSALVVSGRRGRPRGGAPVALGTRLATSRRGRSSSSPGGVRQVGSVGLPGRVRRVAAVKPPGRMRETGAVRPTCACGRSRPAAFVEASGDRCRRKAGVLVADRVPWSAPSPVRGRQRRPVCRRAGTGS